MSNSLNNLNLISLSWIETTCTFNNLIYFTYFYPQDSSFIILFPKDRLESNYRRIGNWKLTNLIKNQPNFPSYRSQFIEDFPGLFPSQLCSNCAQSIGIFHRLRKAPSLNSSGDNYNFWNEDVQKNSKMSVH